VGQAVLVACCIGHVVVVRIELREFASCYWIELHGSINYAINRHRCVGRARAFTVGCVGRTV